MKNLFLTLLLTGVAISVLLLRTTSSSNGNSLLDDTSDGPLS